MENKHGSGAGAGSLAGKGFYIVLFLCAAVIGISAWIMLTDAGTNVDDSAENKASDVSGAYVTMIPAMEPEGEQAQVPAMADAEGPATEEPAAETMEQVEDEQEQQAQTVFADGTAAYVWPVQGNVQTPYSIQTLLYDSTMADWRTHDGIDITSDPGTPVLAAAGGVVADVRIEDMLGTVVEIDHRNGMHSIYANLAAAPPVAAGAEVTMGQVIGSVGSTALGEVNQVSHLHFAMKQDGISADPTLYLPSDWTE